MILQHKHKLHKTEYCRGLMPSQFSTQLMFMNQSQAVKTVNG